MKFAKTVLPMLGLLLSQNALADDGLSGANTAWILTSTALVLMMTIPGLSLFYGGLVRVKNILSVLMQCFAITCMVSLLWVIIGYSLAFSEGGPLLGGFDQILLAGVTEGSMSGDIPESVFVMFQMTFAIITPALIVGGFAERMRFSSMLTFSALWLLVVYAPITHWVWGGGWLGEMGLLDFAGGTVVHITAGVAALVAAIVMGPRQGFPSQPMPPHNMTMTITGAGLLWVGWFGFNAGSALAANGDAGMAMLVTHISASAGALTWVVCEWSKFGRPSALGAVTGMVAGLGTITPASGFVGPGGALVIGISAGFVCYNATVFLKQKLKIDDSLDVFPVHGVGGPVRHAARSCLRQRCVGRLLWAGVRWCEHRRAALCAGHWCRGDRSLRSDRELCAPKTGGCPARTESVERRRDRRARSHPAQRARIRPLIEVRLIGR